MLNNLKMITGYDYNGTVYDGGEFILRKVYNDHWKEAVEIYNCYDEFKLINVGIVETEIDQENKTIRHKKHIISYPYEWTSNMFKDAVLFHLNLFIELDKHGLALKDALPNNIVFDFDKPVFIDFLSLIQKEKLREEKWLLGDKDYSEPRFAVFDRMFIPFMLIPLMALAKKDYALARVMLSEKACNCGESAPKWKDLYAGSKIDSLKSNIKSLIKMMLKYEPGSNFSLREITKLYRFINSKEKHNFIDFTQRLIEIIDSIDVTPRRSAYATYYENKKEDYDVQFQSSWLDKQKNIYKILNEIKPKRVLDIGANTGWFSILAAKMGLEVISTDIDESSIDSLYLYSKNNKYKILPLLMSFDDFTKEIYGVSYNEPEYKDRDFKTNPLFASATERLKSDLILCLGLLHHLILGEGKEIRSVFEILSKLSSKILILEYIDLSDKLIQNEPSFFRNIGNYTKDNYNMDIFINAGRQYFKEIEVMNSNPETRKLLVFKK